MTTITQSLNWRYATKQFDPTKKLSEEQLQKLLEVLRLSPSSFGVQPWKFVLVENVDTRAKLREAAWGQSQITDASHLLVLCRLAKLEEGWLKEHVVNTAKTRGIEVVNLKGYEEMIIGFAKNMNQEQSENWMDKQVYIALGNLLTSCATMEIDACPMEGFDKSKFDEILSLEAEGLRSVVACPVGFRSMEDKVASQKKVRFDLEKIVLKK